MLNCATSISTLDDLRNLIERTICDRQQLLPGAFQLREKTLARNGVACGLYFTLQGLRSVKFSAIWDAAEGTVLFYDCQGERFHRIALPSCGPLQDELAGLTS
jgi:hypothetical protein